ncbi:MAG TPA: DUF4280 domain-containing protein [Candidatus Agathobaculum merdavium]|mgnify:FL=1|nr:DUF4280 domain-containing protein [Candidatus Agathobaculum merdavium]
MATAVVSGASVQCTMGMAPGQLLVTSQATVLAGGMPAATVTDAAPMTNVTPCGMCTSLANPQVAAATAAALGVLTPMPCVPVPVGIWTCAGTPLIGGKPALSTDATLACSYGGSIRIVSPGQTIVTY